MPRGLPDECRRGCRPSHAGPRAAPEVAEALPGVAVFAVAERRRHHLREEPCFPGPVALQGEERGGHGVLAVVVVMGPGHVLAVGNRSLVDVIAEEPGATIDGGGDLRIGHTAFPPHDDRQVADQPRGVDWPVGRDRSVQATVGRRLGKPVAEGAIPSLPPGEGEREGGDRRQHLAIPGEQMVFAEEEGAVTALPRPHVVANHRRRPRRQPPGKLLDAREKLGPAARQERQPVDRAEEVLREGLPGQHRARLVEDPPRLGAVVGCRRGVRSQNPQAKPHLLDRASPPAGESQVASTSLRLRRLDGDGEAPAGIVGEPAAIHAEDHIPWLHHTVGGRATADVGHENLPAGSGGSSLDAVEVGRRPSMDPAPQAGRPEVVGSRAIDVGPLRDVGRSGRGLGRRHENERMQRKADCHNHQRQHHAADLAAVQKPQPRCFMQHSCQSARCRARPRRAMSRATRPPQAAAIKLVGSGTTTNWNAFGLLAVCR